MTIGYVVRNQVPMLVTFDPYEAEFVIDSLAHAIDRSYQVIDFFTFDDEDDDGIWE